MLRSLSRGIRGGYKNQHQHLGPRLFDDKRRRRKAKASIMMYAGFGNHFYASVEEEENPAWDSKENSWRICWDDTPEIKGRSWSARFNSWDAARAWITRIEKKYLKGHRLMLSRPTISKHYFYQEY